MVYDNCTSPVGWYVATYVLRFVESAQERNEELTKRFTTRENTLVGPFLSRSETQREIDAYLRRTPAARH